MDTTKTATHVSLCAGYGGIDLGLKRAIPSLRTIAFSEIEAFACANLVAKMEAGHLDPAPIWTDVKTFPYSSFHGKVDILSGGFPCQPFSSAGKRGADEDPRHLFPYILAGIQAARPVFVFLENVDGIVSAKLAGTGWRDPAGTPVLLYVLRELERVGYRATAGVFSASEVGAPHQRKRIFILAYRNDAGLEGSIQARIADPFGREKPSDGHAGPGRDNGPKLAHGHGCGWGQNPDEGELRADLPIESSRNCRLPRQTATQQVWPARPGEPQHGWEPPRVVGDAKGERSTTLRSEYEGFLGELCAASSSGQSKSDGRKAQPSLGGDSDGAASGMDYADLSIACHNRTDELRLLGNGVVPATAERAFTTLLQRLLTYA